MSRLPDGIMNGLDDAFTVRSLKVRGAHVRSDSRITFFDSRVTLAICYTTS